MQKLVKITHVGKTKEGVSQKTGEPWYMTDVVIEWTVENPGTESYTQSCVGIVRGVLNEEAVTELRKSGRAIVVTMYVRARDWKDRFFTQVDVYLPKEYMLDAKPL